MTFSATPLMAQIAKFENLRSIAASTFTGSYQTVGTPLLYNSRILIIQNDTNQIVTISTDGVNDMINLQSNERIIFDLNTNHSQPMMFTFPIGTQFYVNGSSGTGNLYISTIYGA